MRHFFRWWVAIIYYFNININHLRFLWDDSPHYLLLLVIKKIIFFKLLLLGGANPSHPNNCLKTKKEKAIGQTALLPLTLCHDQCDGTTLVRYCLWRSAPSLASTTLSTKGVATSQFAVLSSIRETRSLSSNHPMLWTRCFWSQSNALQWTSVWSASRVCSLT